MLKGVILSEIDSRNRPIKLEYFVTPCSKCGIVSGVIKISVVVFICIMAYALGLGLGLGNHEDEDAKDKS